MRERAVGARLVEKENMVEERMDAPANMDAGVSPSADDAVDPADRAAFSRAEAAALAHVDEDRSPYGGPMARRQLSFEVLETQRLGSDVRVRIGYRPSSGFSGRSGEEWLLVDSDGAIRARDLIQRPKESPPWVLITLAALSVIAAVILIPVIIASSNPTGDPLYRAGRTLFMRASPPVLVDQIQYPGRTLDGKVVNFQIQGPPDGWKLAVVQVSLFNETSQQVSMVIDENAALLTDVNDVEFKPINVVDRSFGMTGPINPEFRFPDFIGLWRSVVIRASESVTGMLLFEVPPDFEAHRLTWKASDTIVVGFRD